MPIPWLIGAAVVSLVAAAASSSSEKEEKEKAEARRQAAERREREEAYEREAERRRQREYEQDRAYQQQKKRINDSAYANVTALLNKYEIIDHDLDVDELTKDVIEYPDDAKDLLKEAFNQSKFYRETQETLDNYKKQLTEIDRLSNIIVEMKVA